MKNVNMINDKGPARCVFSSCLDRHVYFDLFDFESDTPTNDRALLFVNDGQHIHDLVLFDEVKSLVREGKVAPFTLVGIHAAEKLRIHEYGISDQPDYLGRGDRASGYENFIVKELFPWLTAETKFNYSPSSTAFAGCSLGGLSALDIVTSNPGHFSIAGIFSGSLWWRSKGYDDGYTDRDRIIFQKIEGMTLSPQLNCWLMAGTDDERNDRNQNGIIDSVDDTIDMYELLNDRLPGQISLSIVNGGQHDFKTWSLQFPEFLKLNFSGQPV